MKEFKMSDKKDGSWFKRHKILTAILVLFVLGTIGSALGGGDSADKNTSANESTETNKSKKEKAVEKTAKIGETVKDKKAEFTVTAFDCGTKRIGDEYFGEDAQGVYCIMDLSIKNTGDSSFTFNSSDQKVYNAAGQEYSNDTSAEITIKDNDTWLNEINPGNTSKGKIVFDVPEGSDITKAKLSGGIFSSGTTIDLK